MTAKQLAEVLGPVLGNEVMDVRYYGIGQYWWSTGPLQEIKTTIAENAANGEMVKVLMKRGQRPMLFPPETDIAEYSVMTNGGDHRGPTLTHALVAACVATRPKEGE